MAELAPVVADMAQYLRDTLAETDKHISEMQAGRNQMAVRLAGLDAASDPAVLAAAADYEARAASGRPYEGAEDAGSLVSEAYSRFVH